MPNVQRVKKELRHLRKRKNLFVSVLHKEAEAGQNSQNEEPSVCIGSEEAERYETAQRTVLTTSHFLVLSPMRDVCAAT